MSADDTLYLTLACAGAGLSVALLTALLVKQVTTALEAYRQHFHARADLVARELFLSVPPASLFAANLALMAALSTLSWLATGSPAIAAVALILSACAPPLIVRALRRRRLLNIEFQFPGTLQMVAGSMRAGMGLIPAIEQVVRDTAPPLSLELAKVLDERHLGRSTSESLMAMAARLPLHSVSLATSAIRIADEVGGPLADTMERLAQTLRTKIAIEAKIRTLTTQGRAQAVIIGLLPLALLAALTAMEPAMQLMFTTHHGHLALAAIALLEVLGLYLIRRIVNIEV